MYIHASGVTEVCSVHTRQENTQDRSSVDHRATTHTHTFIIHSHTLTQGPFESPIDLRMQVIGLLERIWKLQGLQPNIPDGPNILKDVYILHIIFSHYCRSCICSITSAQRYETNWMWINWEEGKKERVIWKDKCSQMFPYTSVCICKCISSALNAKTSGRKFSTQDLLLHCVSVALIPQ